MEHLLHRDSAQLDMDGLIRSLETIQAHSARGSIVELDPELLGCLHDELVGQGFEGLSFACVAGKKPSSFAMGRTLVRREYAIQVGDGDTATRWGEGGQTEWSSMEEALIEKCDSSQLRFSQSYGSPQSFGLKRVEPELVSLVVTCVREEMSRIDQMVVDQNTPEVVRGRPGRRM